MKFRRFLRLSISLCALMIAVCSVTFAQQPTGSVVGNTYDQSGATVAGAQVTLRNVATGEAKTLTTSSEGYFEFLALRPATYEVLAEAKGFHRLHHTEIVVNVGSVVRADLHFEVGEVTDGGCGAAVEEVAHRAEPVAGAGMDNDVVPLLE